MTEKLRQNYINANTREKWLEAKEAFIGDLVKRYAGIDAGARVTADVEQSRAATKHHVRFSHLMREWNPISCSVTDLKSIAGKPTSETAEFIEYVLDHGEDSSAWKFIISGDTIHGVQYIPGD